MPTGRTLHAGGDSEGGRGSATRAEPRGSLDGTGILARGPGSLTSFCQREKEPGNLVFPGSFDAGFMWLFGTRWLCRGP